MSNQTIIQPIAISDKIAETLHQIDKLRIEITELSEGWLREKKKEVLANSEKLLSMYNELLEKEGDLDYEKWRHGKFEILIKTQSK